MGSPWIFGALEEFPSLLLGSPKRVFPGLSRGSSCFTWVLEGKGLLGFPGWPPNLPQAALGCPGFSHAFQALLGSPQLSWAVLSPPERKCALMPVMGFLSLSYWFYGMRMFVLQPAFPKNETNSPSMGQKRSSRSRIKGL